MRNIDKLHNTIHCKIILKILYGVCLVFVDCDIIRVEIQYTHLTITVCIQGLTFCAVN